MSDNNTVKWSNEEWQLVAKRAAAFKAAQPEVNWANIVVICQDDIVPERRRIYFNKLSALKPMFDILKLDEQGNALPPPPPAPSPPPPEPPAPVEVRKVSLGEVPVVDLFTEIFSRGNILKADVDNISSLATLVTSQLAGQRADAALISKRLDEVEAYTLSVMEAMDRIALENSALDTVARQLTNKLVELNLADGKTSLDTLIEARTNRTPIPDRIAPIRFLLFGVQTKDLVHIQAKVTCRLKLELLKGNNDEVHMPTNIHYCLVSGHGEFAKRFVLCREKYGGDKVIRLDNGSIGTFAHNIDNLARKHVAVSDPI